MGITSMQWVGVRQSTLVTVFLSYLVSIFQLSLTLLFNGQPAKVVKKKLSIVSVTYISKFFSTDLQVLTSQKALFGCNLHQGGLFQALMSWLLFIAIATLHYINLKDTDAKKRAIADCLYYALLAVWFIGIIVDYALTG